MPIKTINKTLKTVQTHRLSNIVVPAILFLLVLQIKTAAKPLSFDPDENRAVAKLIASMPRHIPETWLKDTMKTAQFQAKIIQAMQKPAEAKPWYQYEPRMITPYRIQKGREFLAKNQATLKKAQQSTGLPPTIITAIIGIETAYGNYLGKHRPLDALATLAFYYPPRHDYFKKELKALLKLAYERKWKLQEINGSYAGAIGIPQFMPSNISRFARDDKGVHKNSDLFKENDAILSIAHFMKQRGKWQKKQAIAKKLKLSSKQAQRLERRLKKEPKQDNQLYPISPGLKKELRRLNISWKTADAKMRILRVKSSSNTVEYWLCYPNFKSIMRYNNSPKYALAVYKIAEAIAQESDKNR